MSTTPEEHNANGDSMEPAKTAARRVLDWVFDDCSDGTTITNDNGHPQKTKSALPGWYSSVGPCVFCPTLSDLDPKNAGFTPGTMEYHIAPDVKVIHHFCGVKPVCAQGQQAAVVHNLQAIDNVDLRAIWECQARECSSKGSAVAVKTGNSKFRFNPETPEFNPDKFNNLEYLNKAIEDTRQAKANAPRGSQEWRNAELGFIAALKKRSRHLIAQREQCRTSDDWAA
ncbi:hypothetical protein FN846DRAFT_902381 [Sphaerosporella brunnea]|uniref:Uncharacterized protein n=1 Tax=Sphaerosporella brunnea TaxID=1250544 RepID=A0A5J5F9W1_9PEZI|nr:hypothetical protein FN846DRAFT_902381 [Sphaerosporella brunnea]